MTQKEDQTAEYEHNLKALKALIDQYTIADLKSMIYNIPVSQSGACCYPAMQTLISLMELIGKLLKNEEGQEAIRAILEEMGSPYTQGGLSKTLYDAFRHGIAHTSLAKGGVAIRKDGDKEWHLSSKGRIDVRIFFEDFIKIYENLFEAKLRSPSSVDFHSSNLRKILKGLRTRWLDLSTSSFLPERIGGMSAPGAGASLSSGMRDQLKINLLTDHLSRSRIQLVRG